MRNIFITNETTVLTDAQVQRAVSAIQVQIDRDFAPAWGLSASLQFLHGKPPAGVEVIHVLDDSDQAGALGYHEVDSADLPEGYVFAKTTMDDGEHWESCLSHEVLEQIADPFCELLALAPWARRPNAALAYEVCDPVENDEYLIDQVPVSNFITMSWFLPSVPAGRKVDFLGLLKGPLTLRPGGYQSYTLTLRTWLQTFAEGSKAKAKFASKHSRASRRLARHKRRAAG